jgi:hypothetical protein
MTDRWMKLMMAGAALAGFFLAYQKYGKKAGHATHSFAKSSTSSLGNGCLTRRPAPTNLPDAVEAVAGNSLGNESARPAVVRVTIAL